MSASRKKAVLYQPQISAPVVPPVALLVDIRAAAATLGISVFAVRNLCWNPQTKRVLKPVRQGLKFLFSPAALNDFAAALIRGEVQFPPTPSKPKARKRAA
jgi:hypothetical protein